MTNLKLKVLGAAVGAAISFNAMAETTMRVATWLPPTHPQNSVAMPAFAKMVEDATEGRVKVVIENFQGHPKTIYSSVEDGIIDASWGVNAYTPGRFSLTGVAESRAKPQMRKTHLSHCGKFSRSSLLTRTSTRASSYSACGFMHQA